MPCLNFFSVFSAEMSPTYERNVELFQCSFSLSGFNRPIACRHTKAIHEYEMYTVKLLTTGESKAGDNLVIFV
jgi:hypothetical protein